MKATARRILAACCVIGALLRPIELRSDTVALWLFDEAGVGDAERVPGKFGRALRVQTGAAVLSRRSEPAAPNPTDSRLNLGAHDWTIECWLRLDAAAAEEGVIFEIGAGPPAPDALVTRFSVLPHEEAFVFTCLGSSAAGVAKRIEYANAEGPPAGVAWVHAATLALAGAKLPRTAWFHVALVHRAASDELRLFLDGRPVASAAAKMMALPRDDRAYLALGRDGASRRVLAGAMDELRVSDHAVYQESFTPPASLAGEATQRGKR